MTTAAIRVFLTLAVCSAPALAAQTTDSTWLDHDRAADSAAAHGRWRDYLHHVTVLDSVLIHHPGVTEALARGYAQVGDTSRAIALLFDLAATGISRNLAADSLLAPLRRSGRWPGLLSRFAANATPAGAAAVLFTMADSGFAAEDIVFDAPRGRHLVSSILRHSVYAVDSHGRATQFLDSASAGPLWAMLALGLDVPRGRLWMSTVRDDRIAGLKEGERPRAGILRAALATGRVEKRFDFPDDGVQREPGDLGVAPNGDVVISDGRTGAIYLIRADRDSLELLVPPGELIAPQQPAINGDGRVIIADYVRGLAVVDRQAATVRWLAHPSRIALNGIDGLVWSGPRTLIGVQNGVAPLRVMRLTLDPAMERVTAAEILVQGGTITDPTHGVIGGSGTYYDLIAHSGGAALGPDGAPRPGTRILPPVVARVRLP